ncbi:MAG: helix-turn-helix domain-containing protein [Eggerthellaceae bacterium]|nr:helix-turn-helix domain-containing protein [Eggerthellaceae bacterium]
MKLDGTMILYLLVQEFESVEGYAVSRVKPVDYPILYDVSSDMSGHTVLVPEHERIHDASSMVDTLCVCLGDATAQSARNAGLSVIYVEADVLFQHLYNYLQGVFVHFERLDARLRACVDTYAGFQSLIDACTSSTGIPCALIDEGYRIVCQAWTDETDEHRADDSLHAPILFEDDAVDLFMAFGGYRDLRRSRRVTSFPGSNDLFMKNLFDGSRLVGTLVMRHEFSALNARYVKFLLTYLSKYVEELFSRVGSFGFGPHGGEHVRAMLTALLAGEGGNAAQADMLLAEAGHEEGSSYIVARIVRSFTHEGREDYGYLARRFELSWSQAYCVVLDDGLFMLVDIGRQPAAFRVGFLHELGEIARDNLAKVGVSRPFQSMSELGAAKTQASIAYERGSVVDPTFWCYRFEEYVFGWLLEQSRGGMSQECVGHPAAVVLAHYDEEHGTELLRTLAVFARCRYNATSASEELFVARSTLLNRLERIRDLTGVDLDDFEERVYLEMSLLMMGE